MKRWIALVAMCYPRSWREEFGAEFDALLSDVKPNWRVLGNVLGGAIEMQITSGDNWLKLALATAAIGAIIGAGVSFTVKPNYVSSAVMSVTPQPDPVRNTSTEALRQRTAAQVAFMEEELLSRTSIALIIQDPRLELYKEELKQTPLDDVIEEMRRNIRIQARPSAQGDLAPMVFSISFSYPDQAKAQATILELTRKFTAISTNTNQNSTLAYQDFWREMVAVGLSKSTPPPPAGVSAAVLGNPSAAVESPGSSRIISIARGLGTGLMLGLLTAVTFRWTRNVLKLAGFALAGFVLALAPSYLIPNRFTSNASMQITPAQLTEDPLAPFPPVTPAAEFLNQVKPQLLSLQTLSKLIQGPRLNLYPEERATKPMADVVQNMLKNDLRIAPADPAQATHGSPSVISISFAYSDRYKAMQMVGALMQELQDEVQAKEKADAAQMSFVHHTIIQRKAGENLEALDVPTLPVSPVWPNRLVIAEMGSVAGLLIGAITLRPRRPSTLTLQPA